MRKNFLYLLIIYFILSFFIQPSFAEKISESNISQTSQLIKRKLTWPDWKLPSPLKRPGLKDDLTYPEWFEGVWDVKSNFDNDTNQETIFHSARFFFDSSKKLIADREFNTTSYAMNAKNSQFIIIKNDPDTPNRQFAKLTEDRYLETKIIGRLQEEIYDGLFLTDELILQILHSPGLSRVSQVETLTEFKMCQVNERKFSKNNNYKICAEQFQTIYNQPGEKLSLLPVYTQKSKLVLSRKNR